MSSETLKSDDSVSKDVVVDYFKHLQSEIIEKIKSCDSTVKINSEDWRRDTKSSVFSGGGGFSVTLKGKVFEQAGVNFSSVEGILPATMAAKLIKSNSEENFFASGVSVVIHPTSPHIPTTHFNIRYLEVKDKKWFGGGSDLTPYILYDDDATWFHSELKKACDKYEEGSYKKFKKWCDEYFYLPHRKEARGIGGIFYDYLGRDKLPTDSYSRFFSFTKSVGESFLEAYFPIVKKRANTPFSDKEKNFQLRRRGRYVEFNLLYDRGTKFGLETNGRTASILMSLPPTVRWNENTEPPEAGSNEEKLLDVLSSPKKWA